MTTSLYNAEVQLSKDIGDYWEGTTTGAGSATTIVDSALIAKSNDWITGEAYDFVVDMTGDTYNETERKISSLDNSTGVLTTLARAGAIGAVATYRVHRLFSASEKRLALVQACKLVYPYIRTNIRSESFTLGNWLLNGDMEEWTLTTVPDHWTSGDITLAQTTTKPYYMRGTSACSLSNSVGGTGYMMQWWTLNDDLKYLRGRTIKFTCRSWCSGTGVLRLAIDTGVGSTPTYSSYHTATSAWNDEGEPLEVTSYISETAKTIRLTILLESETATAIIDDCKVFGPTYNKIDISGLNLDPNYRPKVYAAPNGFREELVLLHNVQYDKANSCIYVFDNYQESDLVIEGIGYLDFIKSGASSTAWDSTIAVDNPQLLILTAQAAIYLFTQRVMSYTSGEAKFAKEMVDYWKKELESRINKFRMPASTVVVNWGINQ